MFLTTANLVLLAQISWPFNPELIRERYGQTALFRFDLGVGDVQKQRCRQDAAAWNGSKQQQAMEQAQA